MTPYDLNLQPTVKHLHLTKKHIELVLKCSRSRAKFHNISQVLDLKSNFSQSQRKTELTCGLSHSGSTRHSPQNTAASSSWPPEWVLPPDASCCPENEKPQASPPRATSSSSASRKSPRRAIEDGWRVHHFWVTDWLTACKHLCCSVKKCRLFRMPHPLVSSSSSLIWACLCVRASQTPAWSDVLQSPPAASGRTHNCERLLHPSVCLVSSRYFTPCSNTFTPARRKAQVWLLNSR